MRELLRRRYNDGIYFRSKFSVRISNGAFGLEIYHIAHASDYMIDTQFLASIHSQIVVLYDAYTVEPLDYLTDNVYTLVHIKETALVLIDSHSDHDFVKHRQSTFQNIKMSQRKRVK